MTCGGKSKIGQGAPVFNVAPWPEDMLSIEFQALLKSALNAGKWSASRFSTAQGQRQPFNGRSSGL